MKVLKPEYIKAHLAETDRRGFLAMMFLELKFYMLSAAEQTAVHEAELSLKT